MNATTLPIAVTAAFLASASFYHLAAPDHAERTFSRPGPVRVVGGVLSLLGAWCLSCVAPANRIVGLPMLLSGLARLLAPDRMIRVNTWTSRYVHGVLMLFAAIGCVWLIFA